MTNGPGRPVSPLCLSCNATPSKTPDKPATPNDSLTSSSIKLGGREGGREAPTASTVLNCRGRISARRFVHSWPRRYNGLILERVIMVRWMDGWMAR